MSRYPKLNVFVENYSKIENRPVDKPGYRVDFTSGAVMYVFAENPIAHNILQDTLIAHGLPIQRRTTMEECLMLFKQFHLPIAITWRWIGGKHVSGPEEGRQFCDWIFSPWMGA